MSNSMQGLKSAILAIFREPSKIPRWIEEILFVLGSYELLAMLGGKIRKCSFF
jgi:hypothetical protein